MTDKHVDEIAAYFKKHVPEGTKVYYETSNHTYEGEEAFRIMFGWLTPEQQAEWRKALAGVAGLGNEQWNKSLLDESFMKPYWDKDK